MRTHAGTRPSTLLLWSCGGVAAAPSTRSELASTSPWKGPALERIDKTLATRSQILKVEDGSKIVLQRAFLFLESGPDEGMEFQLRDRPVVVGRSETCDLVLRDDLCSREHFRLEPDDDGWRVRDLESKSGTLINGVPVSDAILPVGAKVKVGQTELLFLQDSVELKAPPRPSPLGEDILGDSPSMKELGGLIEKISPLDLPVLLQGESGTGKERLARAVHEHGPNPDGPYVVVDCTLLGEGEHMRSELFGHVKGAFTGADRSRDGAFVRANGGTLFLDEIGELPASLQPQLLRVLQEGEIRPLGGSKVERVRVRIVSATHRDLGQMVADGRFRQDLFFRLAAMSVPVPPLRERGRDVLLLTRHFLPKHIQVSAEVEDILLSYPWPGNVRELEFTLRQAAALCDGDILTPKDIHLRRRPSPTPSAPPPTMQPGAGGAPLPTGGIGRQVLESSRERVARLASKDLQEALIKSGGNRNQAARLLGVSRATFFRLLKKFKDEMSVD